MSKLDELQRLCDEATIGPWEHHNWAKMEKPHVVATKLWDGISNCDGSFDVPCSFENAAFIAAARTYMPLLIDVAKAAKGCLGNGRLHGEVCPADDYDLDEGEQPGECECGIVAWRKALAALEQAK